MDSRVPKGVRMPFEGVEVKGVSHICMCTAPAEKIILTYLVTFISEKFFLNSFSNHYQ